MPAIRRHTNRTFAISDNICDRLRYAYGTLGPLLFGQANSNFSDPDAGVETISFSGLVGDPGHSRVPQIRWTQPMANWGLLGAFSVSAETPDTDLGFPGSNNVCGATRCELSEHGGGGKPIPNAAGTGLLAAGTAVPNPLKSPSPDFTAAWYIPQPWGHVDFSLVFRPTLQVYNGQSGAFGINKTYSGYGAHFGGDFKPSWFGWDKDFFTWQAVGGDAIGPYINVYNLNSGISLASNYGAAGVSPSNTIVKPVFSYGGNIGYRHVWTPEIRSNIGAGYYREDVNNVNNVICPGVGTQAAKTSTGNGCNFNKEVVTAVANVFWSPVAFADIGVEYFYAHRKTIGNGDGTENVLLSRFRVRF